MPEDWIVRIYNAGLALFPAAYRQEYGDELQYAIRMSVEHARARGRMSVLRLAGRELRDLPWALLQAHWKERTGGWMKNRPGHLLPEGPIERWKLAAMFLPFLVYLVGVLAFSPLRSGFEGLVLGCGVLLLGLLMVVWMTGLSQGFPAWALPALGLVLFFVSWPVKFAAHGLALFLGNWLQAGGWPDSDAQRVILALSTQALFVTGVALLASGLLRIVPAFRHRVRQEWSLLSLLLYGLSLPPLLANDAFDGLELYQAAGILLLAGGAWLFLVAPQRGQRLLALLLPAVLAPAVMSLGLYQVFPAQAWAGEVTAFRLWEALQPLLDSLALAVLLCLPALFRFTIPSPPPGASGRPSGDSPV